MSRNRISMAVAIVMAIALLTGCVSSTEPYIEVGGEEIPTVFAVAGEKKITGSGTGASTKEGHTASVTYEQLTAEETLAYAEHLMEAGFAVSERDGNRLELAKEAATEGDIVVVEINYHDNGSVEVNDQVMAGLITPNG